jgi:hypothetical protein
MDLEALLPDVTTTTTTPAGTTTTYYNPDELNPCVRKVRRTFRDAYSSCRDYNPRDIWSPTFKVLWGPSGTSREGARSSPGQVFISPCRCWPARFGGGFRLELGDALSSAQVVVARGVTLRQPD